LNNEDYLSVLDTHVKTQPQSKILLVWGARSVSKSRGLQIKTNEWRNQGRAVIDIDLKGIPATFGEFKVSFAKAIKDSNLQVSEKEINELMATQNEKLLSRLKTSVKEVGTAAFQEVRPRNLFRNVWNFVLSSMRIPTLSLNMISKLSNMATHLGEWAKGSLAPDKVEDIILLFQLLELHAQRNPEKPPVVIWREIQNIAEIRNSPYENWSQELYNRLFLHFEPRKQGTSLVPVIFESSDLLWSHAQNNYSIESFRPYLLQPFTWDTAKSWLVNRIINGFDESVFTEAEFKMVWEYSGGHQGTIYIIHNMIREGTTLAQALAELRTQYFARLRGIINEGSSSSEDFKKRVEEREQYLLQLQKDNYSLTVKDINTIPALLHLTHRNILFTDGKIVCPQNMPVQLSIDEYLRLFVK